jgi:hypothetical protein
MQLLTAATLSGCTIESSKDQSPSASGAYSKQQKGITSGPSVRNAMVGTTTVLAAVDNLRPSLKEAQTHGRTGAVVFSERGLGVAYIREQDGRQQVVHNGSVGAVYPEISHLTISPDGQRVSYRFTSGNKQQMVSDGVVGPLYDNARDPLYSPDSRHMAYLSQAGEKIRIVLDDKLIADSPVNNGIFFSRDSTKLVYTTHSIDNLPARLVIQDLKTGSRTVKECLDIPIAVNYATETIAMAVKEGRRQRVIHLSVSAPYDVVGSDLHDDVSNIALSADGKSVVFISSKKNIHYLVLNGREVRLIIWRLWPLR